MTETSQSPALTEETSLKRFDIETTPFMLGASMKRTDDGDWVSYDDVEALLSRINMERDRLRAEVDRLRERRDECNRQAADIQRLLNRPLLADACEIAEKDARAALTEPQQSESSNGADMTEEQIKHMVSRFLGWRLPQDFSPDAGITFNPEYNVEYNAARGAPPARHVPTGTNLFDAAQAEAMVRHMIEELPGRSSDETTRIHGPCPQCGTQWTDTRIMTPVPCLCRAENGEGMQR